VVSLRSRISGYRATGLSWCRGGHDRAGVGESSLARKSLLLGFAMLSLTGCLVADPPQYEEPRRTPPILDLNHAEPSPYWIVIVEKKQGDDLTIKVPVRSDDQGERLLFAVHVDYKGKNTTLSSSSLPPSTLDAGPRNISRGVDLDERVTLGCHQLSLLVAHDSPWELGTGQPLPDAPPEDLAIATWWLNVVDPKVVSDLYTLPNCPSQSEVQQ